MDWMLVRAVEHGLVLKTDVDIKYKSSADIHDQLYDSRDGFGLYYRYEPRNIDALYHAHNHAKVKVHDTVIQRINQSTAGYAPGHLPYEFDVVKTALTLNHSVTPMQATQESGVWQAFRKKIDSYVNQRQWLYRILVEFTLLVILISGWLWINADIGSFQDTGLNPIARFFDHIADVFQYLLPGYFENFIHYIIRVYSWIFVVIVAGMVVIFKWRKHLEHKLKLVREKFSYFATEK
jgi:hypothetical protein